jgi:hypothetical protein
MRRTLKWLLIVDLIAIVIVGGWLLFGWKTVEGESVTRKFYRVFGVYTRVDIDYSNDGTWDGVAYFSRDEPADEQDSRPIRFQEDRDRNGEFDVWVETETIDGVLTYRWKVDTTGDGEPDWEFVEPNYAVAYESIRERRGF